MYFSKKIYTMKKLIVICTLLVIFACKQEEEKPTYLVLSGTVENSEAETAMVRGEDFEVKIPISEEGTFSDTIRLPKNGYYQLFVGRERATVYLEQGKDMGVSLDAKLFDESISYTGAVAEENNYLAAKYMHNEENVDFQELYEMDEAAFLTEAKKQYALADSLLNVSTIANTSFKAQEGEENHYEYVVRVENYQDYHQYYTKNPEFKASASLFEIIKDVDYKDTIAFRNSNGYQNLLTTHFSRIASEAANGDKDASSTVAFLKSVNAELPDGYAKNKLMLEYLRYGLSADKHLEEAYEIYKGSNPSEENLAKISERYNKLKTITPGNASPTFDYENHKGGTTSLRDLSGKYVYVDVWATWCGPCIREIPSLKLVEADYHNKNIEFVSISIDVAKDHDKWKKMVSSKELGGIQLIADKDWKSQLVEDYGILGIPRFILIDPEGKIVSADAPRPSDPSLRAMLDELI